MKWLKEKLTRMLVRYLTSRVRNYVPFSVSSSKAVASVLKPADLLQVEGNQRFSTAVK